MIVNQRFLKKVLSNVKINTKAIRILTFDVCPLILSFSFQVKLD